MLMEMMVQCVRRTFLSSRIFLQAWYKILTEWPTEPGAAYDIHCVRAYAIAALLKGNKRFELERAKKIDALAHTLHDYLSPLGVTEVEGMEGYLRDAVKSAATSGLTLVQQTICVLPHENGCRPGDVFDPRLMTAEGIRPGSDEESELVEAGARVALVLSPPFVLLHLLPNVARAPKEEVLVNETLWEAIIRKGNIVCYTMKEGNDGEKLVEISGAEKKV